MQNFQLTDGDLNITKSKRVSMVTGRDKLVQDLTLWLMEPLGAGYMTPGFGSTLNTFTDRDEQNRQQGAFVGRYFTEQLAAEIIAEIDRVLNLYQQNQIQKIHTAQVRGTLYLYTLSEILNSIDDIEGSQDTDVANIQVTLTTGANSQITFMAQVGTDQTMIATQ